MMKKRTLIMSALAVVLAAGLSIAPAMAYFTDYKEASGSVAIQLGEETTIDESFDKDGNKVIVISNKGPESVYVRARAYAGSKTGLTYSGSGWAKGEDGWYYYAGIVGAGEKTSALTVEVSLSSDNVIADDAANVAVVYEAAKVIYVNDVTQPADWDMKPAVAEGSED